MPNNTTAIQWSIVVTGLAGMLTGCVGSPRAQETNPTYPNVPFRLDSAPWSEPYAGPLGIPKGAQRAVLGTDPKAGGETYYAHFPASKVRLRIC